VTRRRPYERLAALPGWRDALAARDSEMAAWQAGAAPGPDRNVAADVETGPA
jgi:hypothetical protein